MSDDQERLLRDLTKTTVERVRKTVALTTQLLDEDDNDIAFVMMMVAVDLFNGSAHHLYMSDDKMSEEEALGNVLKAFLCAIGAKSVVVKATPEEK